MSFRYPGSKAKLVDTIISRGFPPEMGAQLWMHSGGMEYREPFFGAGAIGFDILAELPKNCNAWINDKDFGNVCFLKSALGDLNELCDRIEAFQPTAESYYEFKAKDGELDGDPVMVGFRKLALHQMSWGGLGCKSGGPLGGKEQGQKYAVGCRWNPGYLCNKVTQIHGILRKLHDGKRLKITCKDFGVLFEDRADIFMYLDPPYYAQGPNLYKHAFDDADHERLASMLRHAPFKWCLSYDDHPRIRELYSWAAIESVEITYTTATVKQSKRPKNQEILISPDTQPTPDRGEEGR